MTEKIIKALSSLKLAVLIIISLATIAAVGTIYEARYDATYAQKFVYSSVYMYAVMGLLCINLIFVMIDRWPWKKRHAGFVMAHVGIITTLSGAYITQKLGVDGSMAFPIGDTSRFVMISEDEINIYSAYSDGQPTRLYGKPVDFFLDNPKQKPLNIELDKDHFSIDDFNLYTFREEKFIADDKPVAGPAIRFQIQSSRVNMTNWIFRPQQKPFEKIELGPAQIILTNEDFKYEGGNVIVFSTNPSLAKKDEKNPEQFQYQIYRGKENRQTLKGTTRVGDLITTGWMDIQVRILSYLPQAKREVTYRPVEAPTPLTQAAMRVSFNGEPYWVGHNSMVKIYSDDKVYYVTYGNQRLDLGFNIHLKDFRVGRYQGTRRAMTYESDVEVDGITNGGKPITISMNNPLKHGGYTFYQSSFDEDDKGNPTVSVLSVNKDPGRVLKYLGSFMIVFGAVILFYFKRLDFIKMGDSQ